MDVVSCVTILNTSVKLERLHEEVSMKKLFFICFYFSSCFINYMKGEYVISFSLSFVSLVSGHS